MTYNIDAFGALCQGYIFETCVIEGEWTHIIHFFHPVTGERLCTTRVQVQA